MACCGLQCSKAFVIIFNLFFWVSGCAFVALGGLFLYNDAYQHYFTLFSVDNLDEPGKVLQIVALAAIGFGGFIIFVGFFGCCGSCQESKCMLGIYIFVLVLISLVELTIGLAGAYCWFYFPQHISTTLTRKLETSYGVRPTYGQQNINNEAFSKAINYTQYDLHCCGIKDFNDYERSVFTNNSIASHNSISGVQIIRPLTCCVLKAQYEDYGLGDPWDNPTPENLAKCQSREAKDFSGYLHDKGCWVKLGEWYNLHSQILIAASGGLVLLQIFTIIFSICEIRSIPEYEEQ